MAAEARAVVRSGAPSGELMEIRGAYMRYLGQGHEIFVSLPSKELMKGDHELLQSAYNREYEALYRRIIPDAEVEVLTWSVTVSVPHLQPSRLEDPPAGAAPDPAGTRELIDPETSEAIRVPLYWRPDLEPGAALDGPAVIAEDETSTFVGRRFSARVGANGHIVIEQKQET